MSPLPPGKPRDQDAIAELIRRRFSGYETLPLFPAPWQGQSGFFEVPDTGAQLRIFDRPAHDAVVEAAGVVEDT